MTSRMHTILAAIAMASYSSTSSYGVTCGEADKVFEELVDQNWNNPDNWTPFGVPDQDDIVCILAGNIAQIKNGVDAAHGIVQALVIESTGHVDVDNPFSLTIFENSRIDGELQFGGAAVLIINADLTISGNGGFIQQAHSFAGTIQCSNCTFENPHTLTLQGDNNSSQSTSMTMKGAHTVQVELVNNGFVVANFGILTLQKPVSGGGTFIAEHGTTDGQLVVGANASGGAAWELHSGGEIEFDVASATLSGDFTIDGGILDVNATLRSTGSLTVESVGGSAPVVDVAAGVSAEFDS